jgi:hypothetical protein
LGEILAKIGLSLEADIEPYLINQLEWLAGYLASQVLSFTKSFVVRLPPTDTIHELPLCILTI